MAVNSIVGMGFSLLFLMAFLHLPCSIQAKAVRYCDKKTEYKVKVSGIEVSPDPVVSGKPATFSISASTDKTISGGKVVIDVSYFGVHVHSQTIDLCKETSCPVSAGDFLLSHSQSLPGFTPPGSYSLKMKIIGEEGHQLSCISFDFSISWGSSVADS
ncbi:uncharacterized protein LOC143859110 [Tasmannia lanceolata]|uniref:uncharacterized protein LOC143859110 n=1 Tax=Tasmannia lanceolata TaxID=3420 RepID=UPI0040643BF4